MVGGGLMGAFGEGPFEWNGFLYWVFVTLVFVIALFAYGKVD